MNENTKEIYNLLQDIFKNVWEQQKYSEVKNGVLLTLNIAFFAIILRVCVSISNTINSLISYKVILLFLMLLLVFHISFIIQSFFPQDSNKEDVKDVEGEINIFFFGDIKKLDSDEYLNLVINKVSMKKEINKVPLKDLSNQIVILSEIVQAKYIAFKRSVIRMYYLGAFFIVYFAFIFLKTN